MDFGVSEHDFTELIRLIGIDCPSHRVVELAIKCNEACINFIKQEIEMVNEMSYKGK